MAKWASRRWERHDARRKALLELHERMETFANDYLITLMHFHLVMVATNQQERDALTMRRDESGKGE